MLFILLIGGILDSRYFSWKTHTTFSEIFPLTYVNENFTTRTKKRIPTVYQGYYKVTNCTSIQDMNFSQGSVELIHDNLLVLLHMMRYKLSRMIIQMASLLRVVRRSLRIFQDLCPVFHLSAYDMFVGGILFYQCDYHWKKG